MKPLAFGFILLLLGLSITGAVRAESPDLVSYQGRVTFDDGTVLTDTTVNMTFTIYDSDIGGVSQWTETQSNVPVADGLFSVLLGSVQPLGDSVFGGPVRYLEVMVGSELITPRTRLSSIGYSQRTSTVDGASGGLIIGSLVLEDDGSESGFPRAAASGQIKLSFDVFGKGSLGIFEPVDSRVGPDGQQAFEKKIELTSDGLVLFGATELDTNLLVAPNGDIVGVGQITMGQNSSPGTETTVLGFENSANGDSSTIGGGSANVANGTSSVIAGGFQNETNGEGSAISGGSANLADGNYAVIGGGLGNSAAGDYAVVPGGLENSAAAPNSYAAGYRAQSLHDGSFVWADHTDADFASTAPDQFLIRATGGVGIGTDSPNGLFDVAGMSGDSSVNLPVDAISSTEILNEPGIASNRTGTSIPLGQSGANATSTPVAGMTTIVSAVIDAPAAGYLVVRGGGVLEVSGTFQRNQAYLQIDDSPGGNLIAPYYILAGAGGFEVPIQADYYPMNTERVFVISEAGHYEFYLEGLAHPQNGEGANTNVINSYLTVSYFPGSYGQVTALVAGTERVDFEASAPITAPRTGAGQFESNDSYYRVDLRELEIKALRARAEAEKAERLLLEAQRLQQQLAKTSLSR